ncbi:P-loop containing nucleoside triphosphate hydrolase protein [Crepidotus variabilis]|uniref:ATP-dependent RNA helicase n=1 Tax=Crepidotus variabilis TaxID=179855 RepID=A0A9P6JIH0_9AGAR|nr:P-loop containing nucleoside triphosphate hydrolase protein [Crepidotus variabilis]
MKLDLENQDSKETLKPPKKKKRLDTANNHPHPSRDPSSMLIDEETSAQENPSTGPSVVDVQRSITPTLPTTQGTLPSFPLPALPDAPSKTELALQGLDKALIDAEIVSSSTVIPVPLSSGSEQEHGHGGTMLSAKMRKRLRDLGIVELFAVQTKLLPFLLNEEDDKLRRLYLPFDPPRDVCVSAPTGSGKTLAYVIPIIEVLSQRVVTRLRALIVLPTRDLVAQVRETIEVLSKGTNLKVGTATGQHSFSQEQAQLVQDQSSSLQGGSSRVDILICTPGRLMDHIVGTPNFSLQHLRFLVIDEADRLLAQSFQDWLARVLAATRAPTTSGLAFEGALDPWDFDTVVPDGLSPTFLQAARPEMTPSFFLEQSVSSCQKLLFSATLTRDPGKISALDLRNPKYFVVQGSDSKEVFVSDGQTSSVALMDVVMEKFSMPATLSEHMVVTDTSQKPLIFFHLVNTLKVTNALVFTKSAESTTRLVRLFEFFEDELCRASTSLDRTRLVVKAYSSDLPGAERKLILDQFKKQEIHILVCSDLISRGIDISHVSHVVSYDVPVDMRKYVHRVGRTARAGKVGDAWTLVEEQEARYFKQMLRDADHLDKVKRSRISEKDLTPLVMHYEMALTKLKDLYSRHV